MLRVTVSQQACSLLPQRDILPQELLYVHGIGDFYRNGLPDMGIVQFLSRHWILFLTLAALSLAPAWIGADFFRCLGEQVLWYPRNRRQLALTLIEYSRVGIVLHATAPAGVAEVWKQRRVVSPFEAHHYPEAFSILPGVEANAWLVLVDYPFAPRREWLLALKSRDGYWASESPYFPDAPSLSDAEWAALKSQATAILPH